MTETTGQVRRRGALREWAIRAGLVAASLLFALLVAEGLSRIFAPISDRRDNLADNGTRITDFLAPGAVYHQVSNEYDARTTITADGYRGPAVSGNPDIVFIGDSFTFGYGLTDDETFVARYCGARRIQCANLGKPGSGTLRQVERLEEFFARKGWRPREVRLFVFAMSGSFSAGNDFVDNYDREVNQRRAAAGDQAARAEEQREKGGAAERLIGLQSVLLRHSNLMRLLKFHAGPMIKSLVVAKPGEERMAIALAATRSALARLDALSRSEGFEYSIYLIVPVQDILRGTEGETLAALQAVAPKPVIPTAPLYAKAPARYYYAFDGHLNPEGNRLLADFLAARDAETR